MRLSTSIGNEQAELAGIYVHRGLDPELAARVAEQLMAHDALGAHARDDIGISPTLSARPFQAALMSSISFAAGGIVPLIPAFAVRGPALIPTTAVVSLVFQRCSVPVLRALVAPRLSRVRYGF